MVRRVDMAFLMPQETPAQGWAEEPEAPGAPAICLVPDPLPATLGARTYPFSWLMEGSPETEKASCPRLLGA